MSDEEQNRQPSYQGFLSAAFEFLTARPNARVLIVVESSKGFETFRSDSPIWGLGAALAASKQMDGLISAAAVSTAAEQERIANEEADRITASVERDKGKAN